MCATVDNNAPLTRPLASKTVHYIPIVHLFRLYPLHNFKILKLFIVDIFWNCDSSLLFCEPDFRNCLFYRYVLPG